jgi:hypothetical protein
MQSDTRPAVRMPLQKHHLNNAHAQLHHGSRAQYRIVQEVYDQKDQCYLQQVLD